MDGHIPAATNNLLNWLAGDVMLQGRIVKPNHYSQQRTVRSSDRSCSSTVLTC